MTPIEKLLPRLQKVRQIKPDQWTACCPAHDDKTPSMSIKECPDGTLLIKDWSGCTAYEVVAAVGLEMHDLFPGGHASSRRPRVSQDEVTEAYLTVAIAKGCRSRGEVLTSADISALNHAKAVLKSAQEARA